MVKQSLTPQMIEAGAELTRRLDKAYKVVASLWLFLPDANSWRLVLAISEHDSLGPKKLYTKIHSILSAAMEPSIELELNDVSVVPPNHPLIGLLRVAIGTGPGISGIRFSGNTINGQYVEDAYIYRIHFGA